MPEKISETILINNSKELKEYLYLPFDIEIPEFYKTLELTRDELLVLKDRIIKNIYKKEQLRLIVNDIIKNKTRGEVDISEEVVSGTTGLKTEKLRGQVESSKHERDITRSVDNLPSSTHQNINPGKNPLISRQTNLESIKQDPVKWAKENKLEASLTIGGVALIGYAGYKFVNWIFGGKDDPKKVESNDKAKEGFMDFVLGKLGIKGEFAEWTKKLGIFGLVVAGLGGAYFGMDKIKGWFEGFKNFIGFENKEEKDAYSKFTKKINDSEKPSVEVKTETLKKLKGEKVKDFVSGTGLIGPLFDWVKDKVSNSVMPESVKVLMKKFGLSTDEANVEEILTIRTYFQKQKDGKKLEFGDNTTIGDIVKKDSGNQKIINEVKNTDLKVEGIGAGIVAGTSQNESQESIKPDNTSQDNQQEINIHDYELAKSWPWVIKILGGHEYSADGKDRALATRVLDYAGKAKYYDMLHTSYLKNNGYDVGKTTLDKIKNIHSNNLTWGQSGYLKDMIDFEKKGGIHQLLVNLEKETDKGKRELIKTELKGYLDNSNKFEKDFGRYIRETKLKPGIFSENTDKMVTFENLKAKEIELGENIHQTSKKFDDEILELRKVEKDPIKLAKKESEIRKKYSEAIDGPNGIRKELRDTQKEMMKNLEKIAEEKSLTSQKFLEKYTKKKQLPGGKIGFVLMGVTAGSILLTGVEDKSKLAYMGGEAVGAFVPGVNMYLDLRQIITAHDLAGDNLGVWERWGLAPAFLVLDTLGSIASLTGVGYAGQAAISSLKVAVRGGKLAKTVKEARVMEDAVRIAEAGHSVEEIGKTTTIINQLKKLKINVLGDTRDFMKIPGDFLAKYKEGMQVAYSSKFLKTADPLAKVSKIAVYGGLGYSVCTGVGELWTVVMDKIPDTVKNIIKKSI